MSDEPISAEEAERLKKKARLGAVALALRTVIHQLTVLGGGILFARLLDQADFGIFNFVSYALVFFAFFGEVGLGGALVRQKEEPTQRQLSTVFFIQLGLATIVFTVLVAVAGFLPRFWSDMPPESPNLLRAVAIDLLLTAFRVVPGILMERHLEFGKLAAIEVVASMSFYLVTAVFAFLGFHYWAFGAGLVAQGIVGCIAVVIARPWKPSMVFDKKAIGPLLRFGLPFQANNLVGLVNGAVAPGYASKMLGLAGLGYITWAQNTAYFPLKVVDIMARVNFPLFSRIHGDKKLFAASLERSIQICGVATFAMIALFLGIGPNLTRIVYTDKWMPAVPLLYIFASALTVGFISPIVGAALAAAGRPDVFLKLSIGWTLLNWIVVLLTTPRWGILGFVGGYVVHVVVGNLAVVYVVKKILPDTRFLRALFGPFLAAVGAFLVLRFFCAAWTTGPGTLALATLLGAAVFVATLALVDRRAVNDVLSLIAPKKKKD